ncbi:MAG: alcohol dehydrogenase catalytic domain-containing protein [Sedimentisphaerales bacterium]|nr:alcohol dehydrogenase catalytic domain-containing protein [Sedimentisphaerales bacterium]
MNQEYPDTQRAVQLVAPDELIFNPSKPVRAPGAHQILCRVEAVGLCFSDLKLLKQFSRHARKEPITTGIDLEILKEIPSYVPGDRPTVPGHEVVVRVCAVGDKVTSVTVGARYLVETDYRWLPTLNSNGSFGYNFEGALQEYVLMDERVITSPDGEVFLVPASEKLSAAAVALVEPWACVENAYAVQERNRIKPDGSMLVVAEARLNDKVFQSFLADFGRPRQITWISSTDIKMNGSLPVKKLTDLAQVKGKLYDDVIYLGSRAQTVETLFDYLASFGLLNLVLGGARLDRDVDACIGRVHYGGIRIIGTTGSNPAESMAAIPATGEIRKDDKINIIGAAGPMGQMHVIRNICQGVTGVSIYAGDPDQQRMTTLNEVALPLALKHKVPYISYNPAKDNLDELFDYIALMVPIPQLVTETLGSCSHGAIINIFAGIPAHVTCSIDLQHYIEKQVYFVGTSGSTLADIRVVLDKVQSGRLDTNLSVAAVASLEGAIEGIRAVENRTIAGKIVVYPSCRGLGLLTLHQIQDELPALAQHLRDGIWNKQAEDKLLELYK